MNGINASFLFFLEGLFLEKAALAPEYVQNRQSLT